MTMKAKIILTVISIVALIGTAWYVSSIRETARMAEASVRIAITDSLINERMKIIDSIQAAFKPETVYATKTRIQYRTLVDSFIEHDTLVLTKRESVIVQAADEAIAACTIALNSCSILQAQKDSVIQSKDFIIMQYEKQKPSFIRKNSERALLFLAGAGIIWFIK